MFDSMDWYVQLGLNMATAAAIMIAALWISGFAKRQINKIGLKYEELDDTLFLFLASLAKYAILAIAIVFVLSRFGIQTTSLVALLGAAGLAIGLALQGTLSNLAAGVMLLGFRPFKIGDFVDVGGHSGTVKAISLFTTEIATSDNVQITIPNGDIWASSIKNYSYYDRRRCDIVIGVSYSTDLKKAEAALRKVIAADDRVLSDPAPFVKVTNLGDSSVDFTLRVWAMADVFWDMKFALLREIKEEFDRQGIDIPYPTSLHIVTKT
ncbi:MAG: mechanosensitive ion channel family protein [Rhodobacteraceae bacterium]|nr:mechanosensitive ion channel family protein [Paracoccaceae bacterium]